jgi:hypothetical protein
MIRFSGVSGATATAGAADDADGGGVRRSLK